jgi:acetolactate synthase regulatory subunit
VKHQRISFVFLHLIKIVDCRLVCFSDKAVCRSFSVQLNKIVDCRLVCFSDKAVSRLFSVQLNKIVDCRLVCLSDIAVCRLFSVQLVSGEDHHNSCFWYNIKEFLFSFHCVR